MRSLVARSAPAIVLAVGAIMLGNLANADAAPKEWDQEGYGVCAQQAYDDWSAGKITTKTYKELAQGCCQLSGGKWVTDIGLAGGSCVAPAAAVGRTVPPGVIKQTLTPDPLNPPPGDITQTFALPPEPEPGLLTESLDATAAAVGGNRIAVVAV